MNKDHLIESIFERIVEKQRTNSPTNEEDDFELSTFEDNKDIENLPLCDPPQDINQIAETKIKQEETSEIKEETLEILQEEIIVESEKKTRYTIFCESIIKILSCKKR
jgi:hypothetical protein